MGGGGTARELRRSHGNAANGCVCACVSGRAPRAHQIMFDMAETTRIDNKVNFTLSCQPQSQQRQQ